MLKQFEKLGDAVAQAWEKAGRDENVLSNIATDELIASRVLTTVEPHDIIQWLMTSDKIPAQDADDFGQPPVNVYVGEGFYIQALFWLDGTTAIHEHSFTGAFGVLHGSSLHSEYSFMMEKAACKRLLLGRMELLKSEVLNRGDVRTILPGDKLIHSLFHLERPSISLVIRTRPKTSLARPQYAYLRPFLAFDDTRLPRLQIVRLRMLESLFATDLDAFWRCAGEAVTDCDPFLLSQVLAIAYRRSDDSNRWNALLGRVPARQQELLKHILPCLKEGNRTNRLLSLRANVHDPTHRFFLALLLNVPQREQIYKLVAQKFPSSDPKALVLQWLSEIFAEERAGIRISPPALVLIDRILDDPDFERSRAALKKHFEVYPEIDETALRNSWQHIQNVDVLKPLFSTSRVM